MRKRTKWNTQNFRENVMACKKYKFEPLLNNEVVNLDYTTIRQLKSIRASAYQWARRNDVRIETVNHRSENVNCGFVEIKRWNYVESSNNL